MKILIATDGFLKLVVEGQALALARAGHEVRLLIRDHALEFGGSHQERREALGRLSDEGVYAYVLRGRRYGPEAARQMIAIRRALAGWAPDVVSAHQNVDPRLAALVSGWPVVLTIHDPEPHLGARPQTPLERWSEALWLRVADRIVVHSDLLLQAAATRYQRSITVIPHGIAVRERALQRPTDANILLFGRMEAYKGVDDLLAAMGFVWEWLPTARFTIAGRGPAVPTFTRSDSRVEVLDRYIAESEISDLLSRSAIVVLPYREASQSGVGLLAISQGIPVVATDVGGLPDLVPPGYVDAWTAPVSDPPALADALRSALQHDDSDRASVLEHAEAHFSWDRVAEGYVRLFSTLTT